MEKHRSSSPRNAAGNSKEKEKSIKDDDEGYISIAVVAAAGEEVEEEKKKQSYSVSTSTAFSSSSSAAAASSDRKGAGGVGSGAGTVQLFCQAEKCAADLTEAKRYHRRHKVCEQHSKAAVVIVAGLRQRFCQQCSRFHELSNFDDSKRSCRRRLAGHNERRRKMSSESQEEGSNGCRQADPG